MRILLAETLGFCFGVQRAVDMIEKAARQNAPGKTPIYMLGKLVHNRQVVERLASLGARLVTSLAEVPDNSVAVISTHGVGPDIIDQAAQRGIALIDATCPFVRRIHRTVAQMAKDGFTIFVFGDAGHKEVQGILAWARGKATAIQSATEVETRARKIGLVAQTTQNIQAYRQIIQEIAGRYIGKIAELRVADTICDATAQRQAAARKLARQVDVMLVVGGTDSANTRRLAELCLAAGTPTYAIEEAAQIDPSWLAGKENVGITAGASTPDWVIKEVVERLQSLSESGIDESSDLYTPCSPGS